MAEHKPTPEEQLLKLIENPQAKADTEKSQPKPAAAVAPAAKKSETKPAKSLFASIFAKGEARPPAAPAEPARIAVQPAIRISVNIKLVNQILIALVISSALYLILDLFVIRSDEDAFLAQVGTTDPIYPILDSGLQENVQDVSYYKQPLERRNPFLSPSAEPLDVAEEETAIPAAAGPSAAGATEIINSLKLVGISMGKDTPVAMIEDVETGKTHFVREGQEIRGVKIQAVTKEKVVVTYEGEEGVLF